MNSDDLPPQQTKKVRSRLNFQFLFPIILTVSAFDPATAVPPEAISISSSESLQNPKKISDDTKPGSSGNPKETKKEYSGPWGNVSNPPITLPLKRPSSEDPEILNKLEFGENQTKEPNESCATHATKLGLNDNYENPKFIRIQFPPRFPFPQHQPETSESSVPTTKPEPSAKGKETVTSPPVSGKGSVSHPRKEAMELSLPPPHAKLRTYKSGKVKLTMGELLFDVIPGIHSETVAQDLVAINTEEKNFCELGTIEKMMVVTLDDSLI